RVPSQISASYFVFAESLTAISSAATSSGSLQKWRATIWFDFIDPIKMVFSHDTLSSATSGADGPRLGSSLGHSSLQETAHAFACDVYARFPHRRDLH